MSIGNMINKLRTESRLTQEQLADICGVSQQSVYKWESGISTPELEKIILIAKYFNISLDTLIMGNDNRMLEEIRQTRPIKPQYQNISDGEFYFSNLPIEYTQAYEEGRDIAPYESLFTAVSGLPKGEMKEKFGDLLFELVMSTGQRADYPYVEPSELEQIKNLRKPTGTMKVEKVAASEEKIKGAWLGRICGCMLGKTVEGVRTNELIPFLKDTGNYPMHRYILWSDITSEITSKYGFPFGGTVYADKIDGMPVDDDTNYVIIAQEIINRHGRDFTPYDVAQMWLNCQSKNAYFTAERVAFCNFINGYLPPESAIYQNPFREWIGAQIRGDYFGYINPGDPETAAEMAWRDASISHIKNGIYGEMFVAAMLAVAAVTDDIEEIIRGGLAQIPHTSRLHESVTSVIDAYKNGVSREDCFATIHKKYDEYTAHGWCHTISNAMIVAASLLYGGGNFGKSVCMAVETGFDTDCNGATVGSVLGMAFGARHIPDVWTKPFNDTLHTSIFGVGTVKISDRVGMTMKHMA